MDVKLTLKLDQDVIELMKVYAKEQHQSLSRLVEVHFRSVVENIKPKKKKVFDFDFEKMEVPESLKKISGIINLPEDYDYKIEYRKILEEKYK